MEATVVAGIQKVSYEFASREDGKTWNGRLESMETGYKEC